MLLWKYIFALSLFLVFYNYIGYAILIFILNRLKKKKPVPAAHTPTVSFIVAAYNEEYCIGEKIANSLEQDYPADLIEYIFITDGSTDSTPDIVSAHPGIRLLHSPERRGKSAALNRAVEAARNDILIFSDANTILNREAVRNIARHYGRERVGGVAGEKKIITSAGSDQAGVSEGLYWKYESFLKKMDSEFYSVVGAAGELFSVRRSLFEAVADNVILDDFVISMKVANRGYVIVYEPQAYAMELPSLSIRDEKKRKTRISAGGFQAMGMLRGVLWRWKYPRLSFLYISHRVLRWTLSPLSLMLAFVSNLILLLQGDRLFSIIFCAQAAFYLAAIAGSLISSKKGIFKVFQFAWYFLFMNISVIQGFFRFLKGKQPAAWEKAKREVVRADGVQS